MHTNISTKLYRKQIGKNLNILINNKAKYNERKKSNENMKQIIIIN